jgi:hypothetical protein
MSLYWLRINIQFAQTNTINNTRKIVFLELSVFCMHCEGIGI